MLLLHVPHCRTFLVCLTLEEKFIYTVSIIPLIKYCINYDTLHLYQRANALDRFETSELYLQCDVDLNFMT